MRRSPPGRLSATPLAVALIAAASLGACGSDERRFSAEEFVRDANRHSAELELGEPLTAGDTDAELYALSFSGGNAGSAPEGSGASLRVTDSTADAEGEFDRCQQGGLICYQAANVVLALQDEADPRALDRLKRAVRSMKSK